VTDDISLPGSASDLAKAIRETLSEARAFVKLFEYTAKRIADRKARHAAANVDALGFAPDGMKLPLGRIARGEGSQKDIEVIASTFSNSASAIEKSVAELRMYRTHFREVKGRKATLELYDEVIWGPCGKGAIRDSISELLRCAKVPPVDSAHVQKIAMDTVGMIEAFNEQLSRLHDLILPPKQKLQLKHAKPRNA
jgi:hypothetical protein